MARNMQPIAKRCKALGISPAVMGYKNKETTRNPKGQMRRKKSEYAKQLDEKQKVKFIYGMLEKQFYSYYERATKMQGKAGENLLVLCERRLDNVVFRLGFAATRRQARQLVTHGHFVINGKRVDIPSYQVKPGEVVAISENSRKKPVFAELTGENAPIALVPGWIEKTDDYTGKIVAMPTREDIDYPVEEHLIVELYSK
ncbi:MAG: 30S ribosomal protein S4 [Clostridia bacterium]|jgi:small subunit ribosomal protein S4|nr:30S ribosomal protein S4 [Clostridia bacterium]MBQ4244186.1 30S ribosomal protein S4 [Clostridia bacterium]